jgi:hypothetical protein
MLEVPPPPYCCPNPCPYCTLPLLTTPCCSACGSRRGARAGPAAPQTFRARCSPRWAPTPSDRRGKVVGAVQNERRGVSGPPGAGGCGGKVRGGGRAAPARPTPRALRTKNYNAAAHSPRGGATFGGKIRSMTKSHFPPPLSPLHTCHRLPAGRAPAPPRRHRGHTGPASTHLSRAPRPLLQGPNERKIRFMSNSHTSQSETLAAGAPLSCAPRIMRRRVRRAVPPSPPSLPAAASPRRMAPMADARRHSGATLPPLRLLRRPRPRAFRRRPRASSRPRAW